MSHLIAIAFDDRETAQKARNKFHQMEKLHLVELEDSAVVYKDKKGKVRIDQTFNLTAAGAASGSFWGLLVGFLFSIPFGGPLLPLITTVFGAGFGALSGHLSDYGVDDQIMKEIGAHLDQGKAALFVLVRRQTPDKVLEALESLKGEGKILMTSFSHELEDKFRQVLEAQEVEIPVYHAE